MWGYRRSEEKWGPATVNYVWNVIMKLSTNLNMQKGLWALKKSLEWAEIRLVSQFPKGWHNLSWEINSGVLFIWYFYLWLLLKLYIFIEQLSLLTIIEEIISMGRRLHCLLIAMETPSQDVYVCISSIIVMIYRNTRASPAVTEHVYILRKIIQCTHAFSTEVISCL